MGRKPHYAYPYKLNGGPPTPGLLSRMDTPMKTRRSLVSTTTVALLVLGTIFFLWPSHSRSLRASRTGKTTATSSGQQNASAPWAYDFHRDARFHGLTSEQCDAAFPHLFDELDKLAQRREDTSLISGDEIQFGDQPCLVRVLIYDGELHVIAGAQNKECWMDRWHERTSGLLHSINRAISVVPPEAIPNAEFVLDLDDDPQRPVGFLNDDKDSFKTSVFGLTKQSHQHNIWLMPDYAYWAWPSALVASAGLTRHAMNEMNEEWPWSKKIPKVIWRGVTHLNPDIREPLLEAADDEPWGDVKVCDIYQEETKKYCIRQHEHCKYMFPVHTEGYTYSGRLKYLQLCNSAPVIHKLKWAEHHTHLLRSHGPEQNYIPVKSDWSDLKSQIEYYLEHSEEAQTIANNSYKAFYERYLTPAATSCYWRKAITTWASVQGYEPQLFEFDPETKRVTTRGVPFEAYAIDAVKPMPKID